MGKPPRRMTPPNRGRKSDKKRQKRERSTISNLPQNESITMEELSDQFSKVRRALILDDSTTADKSQLLEPSSFFEENTQPIRSKISEANETSIVLDTPIFTLGVDATQVRTERKRVLNGTKSKKFKDLNKALKEHRKILIQQERKSPTDIFAHATKHQKRTKEMADATKLSASTLEKETEITQHPFTEVPEEEISDSAARVESKHSILPNLRELLSTEPQPTEFIFRLLEENHDLDSKSIQTLIQHIASPFSVCKTMNEKMFRNFILSLFAVDSADVPGDDWMYWFGQLDEYSFTTQVWAEVQELVTKSSKKVERRTTLVALLYYFGFNRFTAWWEKESVPADVCTKLKGDFSYFEEQGFSKEVIEHAQMLLCALAIEKPNYVAKRYTYAKHQSGMNHENKTETWLKKSGQNIEYITESEIKNFGKGKYGGKRVHRKITPDILLLKPIELAPNGQQIHWIDAKNTFIDPSFSADDKILKFCNQIKKYVNAYGPGLVVWGRDFSDEWNDATKGVVQHIKI